MYLGIEFTCVRMYTCLFVCHCSYLYGWRHKHGDWEQICIYCHVYIIFKVYVYVSIQPKCVMCATYVMQLRT